MSDERFDKDFRSVLEEDAPRDVPEDLRRRVAAVSATRPAPVQGSRPAWRQPVSLWIGTIAALILVLAIGLWRFGPNQPGVGDVPSASPSVVPSTPPTSVASSSPSGVASTSPSIAPSPSLTATPTTSASTASGACLASELTGRILLWQGAAGSRIADIEVINSGTRVCFVRGTPGSALVDATGRVLIDSATAGPSGQPHVSDADPRFELAPGSALHTEVQASNYCGIPPSLPIDIAFTLPAGEGRFVAMPGTGVSSAEAVPPCLGTSGSTIAMNGWQR